MILVIIRVPGGAEAATRAATAAQPPEDRPGSTPPSINSS